MAKSIHIFTEHTRQNVADDYNVNIFHTTYQTFLCKIFKYSKATAKRSMFLTSIMLKKCLILMHYAIAKEEPWLLGALTFC